VARIAFADESGTTEKTKCYAIGVLSFEAGRTDAFHRAFERMKASHGVGSELHWTKIGTSYGAINLALEWLHMVLESKTASFDAMVVNTALYRNWGTPDTRENAFFTTYTLLLKHIAERTGELLEVMIDARSDAYSRQPEVIQIVGNHMLGNLASAGRLTKVRMALSHDTPGIQVADILTGAIAAAHRRRLDPMMPINQGKLLAIERLASLVGWDDLCYDTYPDDRFNIWHFPTEYRADPETRKVSSSEVVPYIEPAELAARIAAHRA
jgi:hypothetical protein